MSDDLPPPDLTKTADVPLDGLFPFREATSEVPAEPGETKEQAILGGPEPEAERSETIFTQARPMRLVMAEQIVGESPILEEEATNTGPAVLGETTAEPLGTLRALWEDSHDRGVPFYRRQGPLAGLGLFALLIIGAISFPWTRATIESGVVILIDESAETASVGAGSDNQEEAVESPTSATLVQGSKATTGPGSAEGFQSTSSQIATTAGVSASVSIAPAVKSAPNVPTTARPPGRQTAETTAVTVIAPVQLSCEDPAAIPPACAPTTEAPTTTVAGETTTTDDQAATTTEPPQTETTVENPTTTELDPTTTSTTEKPGTTTTAEPDPTTTTEPDEPTTTTVPDTTVPDTTDPDTTDPDTTDPDSTTTTTEPDQTTTTEPEPTTTTEPPSESDGTVHPAVGCTSTTQPDPENETSPRTLCIS